MVRSSEADFDLRETSPLSHEYSAYLDVMHPDGVRTATEPNKVTEAGHNALPAQRMRQARRTSPVSGRDSAESGMGHVDNRHLNHLTEFIFMNVGGSSMNAKLSSPPMSLVSVGGVIVLGAQERCARGEGRQEVNIFRVER